MKVDWLIRYSKHKGKKELIKIKSPGYIIN